MKLRYLFVTLLAIAFLVYGAVVLFVQMNEVIQKSNRATNATTADTTTIPTTKDSTQAAEKETVLDTIVDFEEAEIAEKNLTTGEDKTTTGIAQEVDALVMYKANVPTDLMDEQKLQEIVQKYASVAPSAWSEKVTDVVYKVSLRNTGSKIIFLTFNAYTHDDPALFDFLQKHKIKSTFFVTGVWVRRNAERAKEISELATLFEIENHGNKNIPLSANGAEAYGRKASSSLYEAMQEIALGGNAIKKATGRTPRYIRPFLNGTDNVVVAAASDAGIRTIGFTLTGDGGGTYDSNTVKEQILNAPNGAIILLNVNPEYPTILAGLQAAIEQIEKEKLPIRFELLAGYEQYFDYAD